MRFPFLFMDGRSARIPDKILPMPEEGLSKSLYRFLNEKFSFKVSVKVFTDFQNKILIHCLTPADAYHHDKRSSFFSIFLFVFVERNISGKLGLKSEFEFYVLYLLVYLTRWT